LIYFKKIISFLVYSNLFISIAALVACWSTEILLFGSFATNKIHSFVFFATLSSYNLHRIVALNNPNNKDKEVIDWSHSNLAVIYVLFGVGALACLSLFWCLSPLIQVYLLVLGALTLFYSVPFLFFPGFKSLREINGLKIFLIAFVWMFATVVLPMTEKVFLVKSDVSFYLCLERLLFIFLITIPFDIRDSNQDKSENIKTLPLILGIKGSKYFGYCIGILLFGLLAVSHSLLRNSSMVFPLILTYLASLFLLYKSDKNASDNFFLFFVDGTIVLQFLLLALCLFL